LFSPNGKESAAEVPGAAGARVPLNVCYRSRSRLVSLGMPDPRAAPSVWDLEVFQDGACRITPAHFERRLGKPAYYNQEDW
jgi:hypothetical protein